MIGLTDEQHEVAPGMGLSATEKFGSHAEQSENRHGAQKNTEELIGHLLSSAGKSELVINIPVTIEEMHGAARVPDLKRLRCEPGLATALIRTTAPNASPFQSALSQTPCSTR